ncbi:MAG: cytochrome B5 [Deltaproteobacteria bacterium]|nr:MAG: cytochrome B5 [Deltaproteobacteria bacterium]
MKVFTEEELLQYDGREGRSAYVAVEGKVYDVTGNFLWRNGVHQYRHRAGRDLTEALRGVPHTSVKLRRFPVVGTLEAGWRRL